MVCVSCHRWYNYFNRPQDHLKTIPMIRKPLYLWIPHFAILLMLLVCSGMFIFVLKRFDLLVFLLPVAIIALISLRFYRKTLSELKEDR